MKVRDIFDALNAFAPVETALEQDNPGFLVGDEAAEVTGVVTALDCTMDVIAEAVTRGANVIVTHHPVIYRPLSRVTAGSFDGDRIRTLARRDIAVISMHTNLDRAAGGVNDCMADRLGLRDIEPLPGGEGIGRMGSLPAPMNTDAFLNHVKAMLDVDTLRVARAEAWVRRVAVGGGACADFLEAAHAAGCEALVTADCKHHHFLEAAHLGFLLVDATHYATENVVIRALTERVRRVCPNVYAAQTVNPVRFY